MLFNNKNKNDNSMKKFKRMQRTEFMVIIRGKWEGMRLWCLLDKLPLLIIKWPS